jgi:hypothetical protein
LIAFTEDAVNVDVTFIPFTVSVFPERVDVFIFMKWNVDAVTFVALTALEIILLPTIVENNMFPFIVEPVIVERAITPP